MPFSDPGHVNGFYLVQFLGTAGWAKRGPHAGHPLEGFDPDSASDLDFLASLLFPALDGLTVEYPDEIAPLALIEQFEQRNVVEDLLLGQHA